jgi:hypothetical protein
VAAIVEYLENRITRPSVERFMAFDSFAGPLGTGIRLKLQLPALVRSGRVLRQQTRVGGWRERRFALSRTGAARRSGRVGAADAALKEASGNNCDRASGNSGQRSYSLFGSMLMRREMKVCAFGSDIDQKSINKCNSHGGA